MKICPTCNRTYADETLNFCLDDGSTLLYSSGQGREQSLPLTRNATPAPTEVFNQRPSSFDSRPEPLKTIQALQPPKLYSPPSRAQPTEQKNSKRWVAITIGTCLILVVGGVIVLSLIWLSQSDSSDSRTKTEVTNINVRPSPRPTATPEDEVWNETNDAASLTGENLTYYRGTTPEQCKADCEKDQRCKGFTFIRAGAYNPKDPEMCYLASAVTGFSAHSCCISGVKREGK